MQASEVFHSAAGFVALAALAGIILLLPLYLSQRRDIVRLRDWRQREPEHPATDIAASEALLDRAEAELEELLGPAEADGVPATGEHAEAGAPVTGDHPAPATGDHPAPATGERPVTGEEPVTGDEATAVRPGATPSEPVTAAYRVTHERPALERITMERAALEPHPRWRRFVGRVTQPRVLVAIGVAALLLGAGAIYASEELLSGNDDSGTPAHAGSIDPADVTVAILNGTSVNGLAGKVGSDVASSGFKLGAVTNTTPGFSKTKVLYANGQKRAAQKVAKELGIHGVKPVDPDSRKLAGGADVIVIAGEDRASA